MVLEPGVYVNSATYIKMRREQRVSWRGSRPYLGDEPITVHDALPDGEWTDEDGVVREVLGPRAR